MDRRERLELLRDQLTAACIGATQRDLAALSARLVEVLRELDGLPEAKESTPVDDIAARRAARRARASGS